MKSLQNISYKTLFTILFLSLAGIVFFLRIGKPANKVSAAWWDEMWHYRKAISITNTSGSNLTDFQVSISIGTSQLVAEGKMQSDCDDIRITDINGNLVPYWIETSTCNTSTTNIISKIDSLPTTGSTVYIYYGNSTAESKTKASVVPQTCSNINAFLGSGVYYVNPNGTDNSTPVQAYCDMTTDGGGWTLVASWNTAQEWTKTSTSTSAVFDTTAKNAVSSNFGNAPINDFRVLASDSVASVGTSAYADWYYHYDTATSWKEVWAPSANLGGSIDSTYRSTSPRQALKPFNYSYNLKFSYQVTQTWNNLSDWGINSTRIGCLTNYWAALTTSGNPFGIFSLSYYSGSNGTGCASPVSDGSLGICPSNSSNCITGHDSSTNQTKIGYDDNIPSASFGATATSNVGANPPVDVTTKLWWFIRNGTPTNTSYSIGTIQSEESGGGPIAYWKFDEGVGTTAYDSTTNQNNGTISGTTWTNESQCINGKCLYFNGTNSYLNNPNSIDNLNGMTIQLWFKKPNINENAQYLLDGRNGGNWWFLQDYASGACTDSSGNICFNGLVEIPSSYLSNNTWYHVSLTTNSSSTKIYLNGKLINTGAAFTPSIGANLRIGSRYTTETFFDGYIDDVKIYPYARTAAQIKLDYNSRGSSKGTTANLGSAASDNNLSEGLVGYWKMDEGIGTTTADSSGNSNTGTLTNTGWTSGKFGIGTSFNGTNSYVGIPAFTGTTSLSDFTVSTWFYMNTLPSGRTYLMDFRGDGSATQNSFGFIIDNVEGTAEIHNYFAWESGGYTEYDVPISSPVGGWHQTLIIRKGSELSTYFDGVKISNTFTTASSAPKTDLMSLSNKGRIGTYAAATPGGGYYLNGKVDEVRIYNRALSPAEVSQLYEFAPGPIGYWDLNEASGTTINDKSGNNLTGTFGIGSSAPSWSSGKYGGGVDFSSTTKFINIPANSLFQTNTSGRSFSYSLWFKSKDVSAASQYLLTDNEPCNNPGSFSIKLSSGAISFDYYSLSLPGIVSHSFTPSITLQNNTWYHLEWTKTFGQLGVKAYLNGIPQTISGDSTATGNTTSRILLGAYNGTGSTCTGGVTDSPPVANMSLKGSLDDVKIYNYARTPKQIIEDMNANHPAVSAKSILAYYKFDEGYGTTVYNSGIGGTALNGTLSNSPTWTNNSKFNKGLSFDGSDDFMTIPQSSAINSLNEFTISFWINHDGSNVDNYIFYKGSASPSYAIGIHENGTSLSYWTSSGTRTSILSVSITPNQWHQITFSFKENNVGKVYIDGVLNATTSVSSIRTNSENLYFNTYAGGTGSYNVKGLFDEVKIYNYALTPEEVKQDYNAGSIVQFGSTKQTIGGTTTSLEYCIPGDTTYCAPPIAEWKMDEGVGISVVDTSGNNNTGTLGTGNSAPVWAQGKIGKSLNFDGVNDYIGIGYTNFLPTGSSSRSIFGWIKTNGIINSRMNYFGYGGMSTGLAFDLSSGINNDGKIYFIGYNSDLAGNTTIADGKWHYIGVTYNGTTINIYVDGRLDASSNISLNTSNVSTYPFVIGRQSYPDSGPLFRYANSIIDHVKIYNYARTPAQIAYDYNKGGPVGWWKFDECQGSTAYDWSGNQNNGTIIIGSGGFQNSLGTCAVGTSAAWTNGSSGKTNSSLNFDGTDDYVQLTNNTQNILGTTTPEWSYSVWFKTNGAITSKKEILANYDSSSGDNIVGIWTGINDDGNTGRIFINIRGTGAPGFLYTPTGKRYDNSQWHNIIVTAKLNNYVKGYIDGVEFSNQSLGSLNYIDTAPLRVGAVRYSGSLTEFFNGQIDDVRIYNYALTAEQVKTVYNNGAVNFN